MDIKTEIKMTDLIDALENGMSDAQLHGLGVVRIELTDEMMKAERIPPQVIKILEDK